jgi:catechol 2,3-dioxygenase-like lactoylglutathione lyase family enzyme
MSTTDTHLGDAAHSPGRPAVAFNLEVVVIPVADVDRAKDFYARLGWRLDADFADDHGFRIVQLTPPGSATSIQFGSHVSTAAPGSADSLYLVVGDVEAARAELVTRGVDVSEVFHEGSLGDRFRRDDHLSGPAPDHTSYGSFATFSDPDGNSWLLQEITTRLPGRVDERDLPSTASVSPS